MRTRNTFYKGAAWLGMAMSLFFLSCEKEVGGPAQIRIEIADVPYGSDGFRSAGRSKTVAVPLEGIKGMEGLYAYATLKEEVADAELRAFTQGARVRIAVYDAGGIWAKEAIGTYSGGAFTLDISTALDGLTTGASYTFAAFSLNSTTEDPNIYRVGEALEDIDPSKDLLYGRSAPTTINSGANSVLISLSHKFSQVTLVADATGIGNANITAISAELLPAYTADVLLIGASAGVLSPGASAVTQEFGFPGNPNDPVVSSEPRTVFSDGADPVKIKLGSIEINGGTSYASDDEVSFALPLSLGTKYTLTVSFTESITYRWAGSNIYWDGNRLTFDPMGKVEHSLYQGVYFKFGSLVGVSGSEAMNVNTTTMYVPDYTALDQEDSDWRISTITAEGWTNWDGIPYIPVIAGNYPLYLYNLSDPAHYGDMQGDICRYIGETGAGPRGYRMPLFDEFSEEANDWDVAGNFASLIPNDNGNHAWPGGTPEGTGIQPAHIYLKANDNIKFPATGWRIQWDSSGRTKGQFAETFYGIMGYYRGGSAGDTYNMGLSSSDSWWAFDGDGNVSRVMEYGMTQETAGHIVRCIKKLPTE